MKKLRHVAMPALIIAGCASAPPPPPPEPPRPRAPARFTEADAVNVAISVAEAEGYDIAEYSDIVVHENEADHYEVQLRKPRINRFLMVTVDPNTRSGELRVLNSQSH